ncbi:hypothetical protein [Cellulomonas sp. B6]|jgi:hypothetical protein|uniref:hypothetical protein n=1 Tax=Cellulomonas sp. B6 TaxID=1295626 RepID=UPI00073C31BA|nr:hypothetical protein [Cellulomonas sp. B6]KSW28752.1 hypothetical protein ATM99_10820 [Cellulomonas sp. B6]
MSHDPAARSTDPAPEAPTRALTGVLCLVLFVGAFALLTIGFSSTDGTTGALLGTAGILAFGLAFAIPTTILPALEERDRR